ncbi:hypothetical protein COX27_00690 [Candidatus Kuenenbacteria bacterium CG23_combo_of_CG06-09_8_20_14_all_36_9]|nr:MAG: hypothetical protein COX27_00690 [Candidatus Kuenenbacteria bacterium CG23_combo_of_CG06-09_8_20_14_all_36_9]
MRGEQKKAEKYFSWVLQKLEEDNYGDLVPEQIFTDNGRRGVYPLAWSHAMFVLAAEKLNVIPIPM